MKITKGVILQVLSKAKIKENLFNFKFLARGSHNDSYLIRTKNNKYVLRIENNPQFKNLKKEYNILKKVERLNVGPKVFLFDNSHKIIFKDYILEEFILGKSPKRKVDKKFVKLMAKWFKKLHSLKTSRKPEDMKGKYFSLVDAIKPYYKNFKKYYKSVNEKNSKEIKDLFEKALELCKKENKLFARVKKFSILHRDSSKDNILINGDKIKIIDWEFAEIGLPEWELVYFLRSYKFDEVNKRLFLKIYGYPMNKQGVKKLEILSLLNTCGDIGYSLWRLDLLKKKKIREDKSKRIRRLKKDIKLLNNILKRLK